MFGIQLMIGVAMILASVVFHVTVIVYLSDLLKKLLMRLSHISRTPRIIFLTVFTVLTIIGVHTVEAWSWAALYLYVGEFGELEQALYFSVVTATTLGYGEIILSSDWRLLGTFEAMGGLMLFGVSTAFLMEVMRHLYNETID